MSESINVVLVDDHMLIRSGLEGILTNFGNINIVGTFNNGELALDYIKSHLSDVDIVITDIRMPVMDGIELIKQVRSIEGPPVLVLTAYESQADIILCIEAGAAGYLLKDVPEEDLYDALTTINDGGQVFSPVVTQTLIDRTLKPRVSLSKREIEILIELSNGLTNKELSKKLFVSQATIKTHLVNIYGKLGVENRTAAVTKARELRILE